MFTEYNLKWFCNIMPELLKTLAKNNFNLCTMLAINLGHNENNNLKQCNPGNDYDIAIIH